LLPQSGGDNKKKESAAGRPDRAFYFNCQAPITQSRHQGYDSEYRFFPSSKIIRHFATVLFMAEHTGTYRTKNQACDTARCSA
jgi:hypothetical protein